MKLPNGCMGLQPKSVRGPCAVGIDQRFSSYDMAVFDVVRPKPDLAIPRMIFYGKVQDESACMFLMRQYKAICAVGDARPEASAMARLQKEARRANIAFWRAQYNTAPSSVEMAVNAKEQMLTLERTMTLDGVYFALSTGLGVALPQNYREICAGKFVSEMLASTRVPVMWHGESLSRWDAGSAADHSMHAVNYGLIAFKLAKLHLPRGDVMMPQKGIVESSWDQNMDDNFEPLWDDRGNERLGGGVVLQA